MIAKVYGVWSAPNKPSLMDFVMLEMQETRLSLETAITKGSEAMNAHLLILGMIALPFSQTLLAGESPSIEGTWSVVSVEYAGQPVAALEGAILTLAGGKKTFKLPSGVVEQGTYTLDAAREPQRIDATTAGRSETARGIYSLEGDTLRMCFSQLGTRRPTEFATKMGSDLILMVLKRDPAKTASPPTPPASPCKPASSTEPVTLPKLTGTRHFRMGFTGFPHDFSLPAVSEAREFSRENADIIAHHIEGVPWAEALEDRPFSKEMTDEWKGKKAATPPGGKVYLAVSPGRGGLKVAEKGLPLPPELKGKAYDDPLVKRAFLDYCRRGIDFFRPDYLAIGIEVNEIHAAGTDKWRAYVELHDYVYGELKKEHENLPVFASFTLHGVLNVRGKARDEMLAAYQQIMPHNDVVAVSFYPFIAGGTTDIAGRWTG